MGTLFSPSHTQQLTGVIVLPGSDGGIPEVIAKRIAGQGYSVLALGYFGVGHLPRYLENIHLEYFQNAIEHFRSLPQVKKSPIILVGYSRGGELALLLGAWFRKLISGIVAFVPSSVVCGGFPYLNRPAWLLHNHPVSPFLHALMSPEEKWTETDDLVLASKQGIIPYHNNTAQDPYEIVDLFMARHQQHKRIEEIALPVEQLECPLLIISGGEDKIWPSALYAQQIMDRLAQKGSKIQRKSLVYPHAGHGMIAPYSGAVYHRVGKFWCLLGGTAEENWQASENAWQEVFNFMDQIRSSL